MSPHISWGRCILHHCFVRYSTSQANRMWYFMYNITRLFIFISNYWLCYQYFHIKLLTKKYHYTKSIKSNLHSLNLFSVRFILTLFSVFQITADVESLPSSRLSRVLTSLSLCSLFDDPNTFLKDFSSRLEVIGIHVGPNAPQYGQTQIVISKVKLFTRNL